MEAHVENGSKWDECTMNEIREENGGKEGRFVKKMPQDQWKCLSLPRTTFTETTTRSLAGRYGEALAVIRGYTVQMMKESLAKSTWETTKMQARGFSAASIMTKQSQPSRRQEPIATHLEEVVKF